MLIRLSVAAAMALGLVATDAAALADSASARVFKGKTAQGHRIKINVKNRRFKLLRFKANLRCGDGTTLVLDERGFLWTRTGSGGSFRDAQFGKTDKVYFRGRLKNRRIQGRILLTDRIGRKGRRLRCKSKWIRFSATP